MPGPVVSRKLHFLGDFCGQSRAPPVLRGVGGLVCRGGIYAAREVAAICRLWDDLWGGGLDPSAIPENKPNKHKKSAAPFAWGPRRMC